MIHVLQHGKKAKGCRRMTLYGLILFLSLCQISCKKYLDQKRDQFIATPTTLTNLQNILDNEEMVIYSPRYLEYVADNFYLTSESWNSMTSAGDRLTYIWDKDAQDDNGAYVWVKPYRTIYMTNFVLGLLPEIEYNKQTEQENYNHIKGTALFYRAFMFHQLAQLFCKPYDASTANTDGIVLRQTPEVLDQPSRSTVQQTYDLIISDLKLAADLLPKESLFSTRPTKAAAFGALARVYLSMRDYVNADKNANYSLAEKKKLLDFNSLIPSTVSPLSEWTKNPEILFLSVESYQPSSIAKGNPAKVDTNLYQSYHANDLRKTVFFGSVSTTGLWYWQGSYFNFDFSGDIFDGLATDEIYLIRAECRARANDTAGAMNDLNTLLSNRWKTGTFNNLTASNAADALDKVLTERRKELVFRGLRWSDLRRFNLEGANITLKRVINNTTYTLPPNDLKWVLLIPNNEIIRSGITQNPR